MQVQHANLLGNQSATWLANILKEMAIVANSFAIAVSPALADEAEFNQCRQFFAHGKPPIIRQPEKLRPRALCFSAFAISHSGASRTPIYVAERLNRTILLEARNIQRSDRFFADARLPRRERAEMEDYQGAGFDRGHMAPAADMSTDESMTQSFSLANIVPQAPINNRKAWAEIEKATRKYVMRAAGDVFVITGPIFDGSPPTIGFNKVWVPQYLFKLVFDPSSGRAWAHWLDNTDGAKVGRPISYAELTERVGMVLLPGWKQ